MSDLNNYKGIIEKGGVVAFPTETVYGLGADAWNPSAIQKIFSTKGRPSDNPLIVHISNPHQVKEFARYISPEAKKLIEHFWPGPLSIVFKKKREVLDFITAGLDTVAVRMPSHSVAQELITLTGPLVAPSANSSGKPSPTTAQHVLEDFGTHFPVIDGGKTDIGLESTVVDCSSDQLSVLRPGSISKKEIEDIIGSEIMNSYNAGDSTPKSPGQKYTHYKPNARVVWTRDADMMDEYTLFLLSGKAPNLKNVIAYNNDLNKFANELYDRFRQADHDRYYQIAVELSSSLKNHPLYEALLNRISKAIG